MGGGGITWSAAIRRRAAVAARGRASGARSVSLQGCPREVRLLLAGPYYYDVDMVNSLPNVARQLEGLGMVSAPNLLALRCRGARRPRS